MAKLDAKSRGKLKPSQFAEPGKKGKPGKYPVNDKASRATSELAKGNLSPEQAAKVRHKADTVLGKTDSTYHHTGR